MMNLRSALFAIAILAFLTAGIGGAFYYHSLVNSALKDAETSNRSQAVMVRNLLHSIFSENIKAARVLAGLSEIRNACTASKSENIQVANDLLAQFNRSMETDVCYFLDQNGVAVASSNNQMPGSFVGHNYAFRPYFIKAMAGQPDIFMGLGVTSQKRGVYFSYPIYKTPEDNPAGVAVVKISIAALEQKLNAVKKSESGVNLIINPEGKIVVSDTIAWLNRFLWEKDFSRIDTPHSDNSEKIPENWAGLKKINLKYAVNQSGLKFLYNEMPVPGLEGWQVIYLRDIEALHKRLAAPFFDIAGFMIVSSVLLIACLVFYFYKKASSDIIRSQKLENKLLQLSQAVEQSPVSVVITNTNGEIEYVNPKFEEITGYMGHEVIGQNPKVLQSGKMPPEFYKRLWSAILSGRTWKGEFINKRKSGEEFWEKASISPIKDNSGRTTHFIGIKEDISQLKKSDRRLRNSVKFLQQLIDVIPAPVFYKDSKGIYRGCNKAFESFIGIKRENVIGKTVYDLLPEKLADKFHAKDQALFDNPGVQIYESELKSADGERHHVMFNKATFNSDLQDGIGGLAGVMLDITERKKTEEKIRYHALHDNLTGLPNRYLFFDRLQHAINDADRNHLMVALLYFDLDGFKAVNDAFGHKAGDNLLKEISDRMTRLIRATDTVARIGGDEFAIILPGLKAREPAEAISKKIIHSVSSPFEIKHREVLVGVSIGISIYPEHTTDIEDLVQKADAAMYQVKNTAKGGYTFYENGFG